MLLGCTCTDNNCENNKQYIESKLFMMPFEFACMPFPSFIYKTCVDDI